MLVLESGGNDDVYGPEAVSSTYIAIEGRWDYDLGRRLREARCKRSFVGSFACDPPRMARVENDGLKNEII